MATNNQSVNDAEIISQEMNTEVLYQQDKAQVDIQISTAKNFPRNITRSIENAIAIVSIDQKTAATCTYSVPRGGKAITGPSVHLAKIIAQQWKNMRIESRVIDIDAKHVTCQGICWDLENNIAIKTEVKRSIMTKFGRMNDDMITVTGNAGNSIALRNAIFAVVPKAVVDKVYTTALNVITGDVSDETKLIKRRTQVFDALKDTYGVSEKEVLTAVGKSALSHITPGDLAVIIGFGQAIKDGDTTVELAFKTNNETKAEDKKAAVKAAKDAVKPKVDEKPVTASEPSTNEEEKDMYVRISDCKTQEELTALSKQMPSDDFDLALAVDTKKRELASNPNGELFDSKGMA